MDTTPVVSTPLAGLWTFADLVGWSIGRAGGYNITGVNVHWWVSGG